MFINIKKLASEVTKTTGLRMLSAHPGSDQDDPDIEFADGVFVQISWTTPDHPYVLYRKLPEEKFFQIGDYRTHADVM